MEALTSSEWGGFDVAELDGEGSSNHIFVLDRDTAASVTQSMPVPDRASYFVIKGYIRNSRTGSGWSPLLIVRMFAILYG